MTPEVPGYDAIEQLGNGSTASLWLARRRRDARLCALKVMPRFGSAGILSQRFLREAEITAKLSHPNIARTYESGHTADLLFIAMEYVQGVDLATLVSRARARGARVTPSLAIAMSLDVLGALDYAHSRVDANGRPLGIVHRDISFSNVMITFDGTVKLIDFGLVRSNIDDFRTAPGHISGTPLYMSPQQVVAEEVDHRSDLYSWAAVLYELVTGNSSAHGSAVADVLISVVRDDPPPPSTFEPGLPPELDAVMARALAKEPEDRFQTAREFAHALAGVAEEMTLVTTGTEELVRILFTEERAHVRHVSDVVEAAFEETMRDIQEPPRPRDVAPWVYVSLGAVAGAVATASVFLALG